MIVLTLSVIIHKIPLAFTVGTTLISQGQSLCSCTTLTSLILFIVSTPVGVGIGMSVSQAGQSNIGLIVVQGLAGGTFIYLSCCDLIIHVFHEGNKTLDLENKFVVYCVRTMRFLLFASGVSVVLILAAFTPKHSH